MEIIDFFVTIKDVFVSVFGMAKEAWVIILFVVMYINSMIKSEKLLTEVEDEAKHKEGKKLEKKVVNALYTLDQNLFDGMQKLTYSTDGNTYDKVVVQKGYGSIRMSKKDFFRDHHDAVKDALNATKNEIIDDIETLNLGSSKTAIPEETHKNRAFELCGFIKTSIRKRAGATQDSKEIECDVVTFEVMYSMYINIIQDAQALRGVRDNEVKKKASQYRVPLLPKFRDLKRSK